MPEATVIVPDRASEQRLVASQRLVCPSWTTTIDSPEPGLTARSNAVPRTPIVMVGVRIE